MTFLIIARLAPIRSRRLYLRIAGRPSRSGYLGDVAELADALDLGSSSLGSAGSIPVVPIRLAALAHGRPFDIGRCHGWVSLREDSESNVLSLSKGASMHSVYILQCADGSFYVGSTQDVSSRLEIHNSGNGPDFTARRLPVRLAYQESFATLDEAVRREKQLKGWSRAKKEALISSDLKLVSKLAACRQTRQKKSVSHPQRDGFT